MNNFSVKKINDDFLLFDICHKFAVLIKNSIGTFVFIHKLYSGDANNKYILTSYC